MNLEELGKLFNSLSAEQQEAFAKIATDFVAASSDPDVVPMLLSVPKTALSSKGGMVRIPTQIISEETKDSRRSSGKKSMQKYREQMTPEQKAETREKAAAAMRELRAKRKAQSSDPSP